MIKKKGARRLLFSLLVYTGLLERKSKSSSQGVVLLVRIVAVQGKKSKSYPESGSGSDHTLFITNITGSSKTIPDISGLCIVGDFICTVHFERRGSLNCNPKPP